MWSGPSPARTAPLAEGAARRVRSPGEVTRGLDSAAYGNGERFRGQGTALLFPAQPVQNRPPPPQLAGFPPASWVHFPPGCGRLPAPLPGSRRAAWPTRARRVRVGEGQGARSPRGTGERGGVLSPAGKAPPRVPRVPGCRRGPGPVMGARGVMRGGP